MSWLAHFILALLLPMWVKYGCCVRARYLGMKPNIIDGQTMQRISECSVRFEHCGRSFTSPTMYMSALTKIFEMSGSVFPVSIHFLNASTDTVQMMWLPSWVHWYRLCIVSRTVPWHRQMLVDACPYHCRILMAERVLLIHFVMKCDIWGVVLSRSYSNGVMSVPFQYSMWVSFWSTHYWSIQCL